MTTPLETGPPAASDQYVQSLARGLNVLRAFDADHAVMTLSEVAARTELTRATARRFLHTLVELGYARTDGRTFSLTAQVLSLGYSYLSALSLPELAQPRLEELSAAVGESTSAAVLDEADILYVARVATRRIMNIGIAVGTRFPAYATSMGRVLLAALPPEQRTALLDGVTLTARTPHTLTSRQQLEQVLEQVHTQGWCLLDQELELGLMSLAAPIHNTRGEVVAAVNVSFQAQRLAAANDPDGLLAALRTQVLATAAGISADLGNRT